MSDEDIKIHRGLNNVYFDRTKTTYINGKEGVLEYRGYNIHDLSEKSSFEEVSYLLLYGKLPTKNEIDSFKLEDPKAKKSLSVKYAKGLQKRLNQLQSDCKRSIKERKPSTRQNNNSSGFLKPVKISDKLAKFTGWDPKVEKSRVDVTKYLCNYIKAVSYTHLRAHET